LNQEEVVVISAVRSPFGKFGGVMKDFTLPKLGGSVTAEAIRRAGIAPGMWKKWLSALIFLEPIVLLPARS
jgi:acetyl-CoA acetyltransferase